MRIINVNNVQNVQNRRPWPMVETRMFNTDEKTVCEVLRTLVSHPVQGPMSELKVDNSVTYERDPDAQYRRHVSQPESWNLRNAEKTLG